MSISNIAALASSASFRSQHILYIAMEPAAPSWHSIPEDCPRSSRRQTLAIHRLPHPTKMTSHLKAWYMHACRAQWLGDQSKLPGAQFRPRVSPGLVRPLFQLHRLHAYRGCPLHKGHPTGMQSPFSCQQLLYMCADKSNYAGHGFGIAAGNRLELYNVEQQTGKMSTQDG